jgi:hypothetical protein
VGLCLNENSKLSAIFLYVCAALQQQTAPVALAEWELPMLLSLLFLVVAQKG